MTTIYLYEDNAGGLYLERDAGDYADGRRVSYNLEYSGNTFVEDAAALALDPDAWTSGMIGSFEDYDRVGYDSTSGEPYDVDRAMSAAVHGLIHIATYRDGVVELTQASEGYSGHRYLGPDAPDEDV